MAVAPIVESTVKYREGKKWRERWCVLKKPSPVADCLSVMLYKDSNKQNLKSNLVLDEFCGVDSTSIDGEKYILSIICCNKTLFFSFGTEELRDQWKQKLLLNFGEDICFKVELTRGLLEQRSSSLNVISNQHGHLNSCNLYLTSSRMSLTTTESSSFLLRHLCSWRYMDVRKYGCLGKNSYGIQALLKEGEKSFVFRTHQSAEIDEALKSKVQSVVHSRGLFEQLLCSVSVTNPSAFSASASNPSTPTFCISSESSKSTNRIDRRFSSPHSHSPLKSHAFSSSLENTLRRKTRCSQQLDSRSGSELPERQNGGLVRHFSEYNLHASAQERGRIPPVEGLNSSSSCEGSVENCLESASAKEEAKTNYVNYEGGKNASDVRSEGSTYFPNEDGKHRGVYAPRNSRGRSSFAGDAENSRRHQNVGVQSSEEFYFNESNVNMMNGGLCANKSSVAFDPLQPLPYRDLSRYDGESDEGYLYWLPGSSKNQAGYINISALKTKESKSFPSNSRTIKNIGDYLKPNSSSDSLNLDSFHVDESCLPATNAGDGSSYINVSGIDVSRGDGFISKCKSGGSENVLSENMPEPLSSQSSDYVPINQLSSDLRDDFVVKSDDKSDAGDDPRVDYLDMTGTSKILEEEKLADLFSLNVEKCDEKVSNAVEEKSDLEEAPEAGDSCERKDVAPINVGWSGDREVSSNASDLMKKIHLSPPPPLLLHHCIAERAAQEYINLSSVSMGESALCLSPPPRPPKILNCIKEDVSESSIPPPLPEKVKHSRGIIDQDFIRPLPVPVRRRDLMNSCDFCQKPPLPRRTCQSSVNLHSSPPPGMSVSPHVDLHHQSNRCSTSFSSCLPKEQTHPGGRPVSASSVPRHRKPNLTVDIQSVNETEHGKLDTPISIVTKRRMDDANRYVPALVICKPRNGKEYVDRRRLAEENSAPSLPPHSAQRSPSVASTVFTFDDKSVVSNQMSWHSSGEDSPKYPPNVITPARPSMRSMSEQKWQFGGQQQREIYCNGSPGSYRFDYSESPRTFSTSTVDTTDTLINYADIDVLPGEFCFDQSKFKFVMAASPPPLPDNRTVYAKIDVAATSAVSMVGRQHAKQREDTLEKRAESSTLNKYQCLEGSSDKRKLSVDLRKQSSLSIKD